MERLQAEGARRGPGLFESIPRKAFSAPGSAATRRLRRSTSAELLKIPRLQLYAVAWSFAECPSASRFDPRSLAFAQCNVSIMCDGILTAQNLNQDLVPNRESHALG
jgi:hypothetical protein